MSTGWGRFPDEAERHFEGKVELPAPIEDIQQVPLTREGVVIGVAYVSPDGKVVCQISPTERGEKLYVSLQKGLVDYLSLPPIPEGEQL